ncbi:MAG: TAXI family TRAP transporter solute-binding subunit [Synergistetes bacterium]|nr:TAXI family TRAP transporter solute-binding subunit [Synergistota bacterium]
MRKWVVAGLLIVALSGVAFAATYEWCAGAVGGGWYTMAAGIAELVKEKCPDINIKVLPGAGVANSIRVGTGKTPFGWGLSPFINAAVKGRFPYKRAYPDLTTVGADFSPSPLNFVAADDKYAGVHTIADFIKLIKKGKPVRIAVTKVGSADEFSFNKILAFYGLSVKDIEKAGGKVFYAGYAEQVTLFRDRHVGFVFNMLAYPASAVVEMSMGRKLHLLDFPDDLCDKLVKDMGYKVIIVPHSAYPKASNKKDIRSLGMASVIMAYRKVPVDVVYKLTKVLCENVSRLKQIHASMAAFKPEIGWKNTGGPLHPGAEKYYREKGYLK